MFFSVLLAKTHTSKPNDTKWTQCFEPNNNNNNMRWNTRTNNVPKLANIRACFGHKREIVTLKYGIFICI